MNKKQVIGLVSVGVGVVGAVATFLLWRRLKTLAILTDSEETAVRKQLLKSLKKVVKPKKNRKKQSKAALLLRLMKSEQGYTQVELQKLAKVPYRSVRRYVEILLAEGKLHAVGYGKGKKFVKT